MSGHSKWATTKRQKAITDAKRGAVFTKIGNMIAIAARKGTDPVMNPSLAAVIEKAKAANMPKANIDKAIARVADKNAAQIEEATYEGYGPNGVGFVIETATDNKNRTFPEVRTALTKNGGRLADAGSVLFQFAQKGVIITENSEDNMMIALDAGAADVLEDGDEMVVYTEPKDLMSVRKNLIDAGLTVNHAELEWVPNNKIELDEESKAKVERIMDVLDDLDDVTNIYTNADI